ncbi:hypothetical protein CYMTET_8968 [Cymbomonas tetramitiformis]|uniref:SNF2 N-terminal domain-containing protein n=1 Tax=Cymbomonas tetramitiformis TaxID=36881 RepID=A0AAE0GSG2_9CHLO|nr:hypothetical protein CYMTET_8968 [Cymbomonas tetramitiformis]
MLKTASNPPPTKISPFDLLKASLDAEHSQFSLDAVTRSALKDLVTVKDCQAPAELHATLREYQARGFQWLVSNCCNGFGAILADDMGLGKTVQTITALLHLQGAGLLPHPALIVVPTSLLSNWMHELRRFAPSLQVRLHYGETRGVRYELARPRAPALHV